MKQLFILSKYRNMQIWMLLASFLVFSAVLVLQYRYQNTCYGEKDLQAFQEEVNHKEKILERNLVELSEQFEDADRQEVLIDRSEELQSLANNGIYVFYYEHGLLSYWSDHTVWLWPRWRPALQNLLFVNDNGIYITKHVDLPGGELLGLIKIKTAYSYENRYLKNEYQSNFKLRSEIELTRQPAPGYSDINNLDDEYLFSLNMESFLKKNPGNITLGTLFFFIAIALFFGFLSIQTDKAQDKRSRTFWLSFGVISLVVLSCIVLIFQKPTLIFQSSLFQPEVYASLSFASLGHVFLVVLLALMMCLLFYWFFSLRDSVSAKVNWILAIVLVLLSSVWFVFVHHLEESLVMDSTLSLEAYKLNKITINSILSVVTLLLAYLIYGLIFDKALRISGLPSARKKYITLFLVALIPQIVFLFISLWKIEYFVPVFFVSVSSSLIFLRTTRSKIVFSRYFPLLIVLSLFMSFDLQKHISDKKHNQVQIELEKLSSEHDLVAEMLFEDLSQQIKSDSLLIRRLSYEVIDLDRLYRYLQRTYFSGYWTKYDLQVIPCGPSDSLLIDPKENYWVPCYPFFDENLNSESLRVEDSDFYFLPNLNGRISYLGVHRFNLRSGEITLYFELNSKIVSEALGYPSLLLRNEQENGLDFSYAKYHNDILVTSNGEYNYRREAHIYTGKQSRYEYLRMENYDHTIYNINEENTVIVSIPVVSLANKLISFSYLFALVFVSFILTFVLASINYFKTNVTWDFKNKIQYSMLGILFLTFLVICGGTVYFIIQQYRVKHQDNLDNTMRSLYIELMHKVEFEEDLRNWYSDTYYNLDELLRKFSNVFNTDINMYDKYGILLATSRAEIFDQQLLSDRMNPEAYEKLAEEKYSKFTTIESIGDMSYQSAYVPLLNNENRLLAYLNLPYFTQPEVLAQEVTNLIVAILNLYVILLLLILFVSVFLADRITQPLRFIQNRIARLSLSKTNEKIVYKGKDEIAGLVDEYNYMVDELARSARLLASSERETAWREMAKQIAHEIKNPLTPMKLNVQHLMRILEEDSDNIKDQVTRVSRNLIEQIDLLSSIASEFSDFAKMPKAKSEKIDLVKKLKNVLSLYENSSKVDMTLDLKDRKHIFAFGDGEQFQRVIINLVKNGIQAIPEERRKKISIELDLENDDFALITIKDNGKGIPVEIRDKLFQPNFTTKSAGMGMGLAISASIIESMDGEIWYETEENEGTSFYVRVPLYKDLSSF